MALVTATLLQKVHRKRRTPDDDMNDAIQIGRSNAHMAIDQWSGVDADAAEHFGNYEDNVDLTTDNMSDDHADVAARAFQAVINEHANIVAAIRGW